jgi:mono/diheme cytochrome c family protein
MTETIARKWRLTVTVTTIVAVAAVMQIGIAAKGTAPPPSSWAPSLTQQQLVERGKYLVTIGGCNDCHTPWIVQPNGLPGPDTSRALSGHPQQLPIADAAEIGPGGWSWASVPTNTAFSGPWGVSFAANLSPDVNTGTGTWTFDIFKNAIRNGRHWGQARPLLPPMPWFNYREMTDEDLAAVFAYTRTLKPVRNQVQLPLPPPGADAGNDQLTDF